MDQCTQRDKNPGPLIVKNVCALTSKDPRLTPQVTEPGNMDASGVLTLRREAAADAAILAAKKRRGGNKSKLTGAAAAADAGDEAADDAMALVDGLVDEGGAGGSTEERARVALEQRGGVLGVQAMAGYFGARLLDAVAIWPLVVEPLAALLDPLASEALAGDAAGVQAAINAMQLLETVAPAMESCHLPAILEQLPALLAALSFPCVAVRYKSAVCLAELAAIPSATLPCLNAILAEVVPRLGDTKNEVVRQGAAEALYVWFGHRVSPKNTHSPSLHPLPSFPPSL